MLGVWVLISPQEHRVGEVDVVLSDKLFAYPNSSDDFLVLGVRDDNPVVAYKRNSVITIYAAGGRDKYRLVQGYCKVSDTCNSWISTTESVDVNYISFEGALEGVSDSYHLYGFTDQDIYLEFHGVKGVVDEFTSSIVLLPTNQ